MGRGFFLTTFATGLFQAGCAANGDLQTADAGLMDNQKAETSWADLAQMDIEAAYRHALEDHPGAVDDRNPDFRLLAQRARQDALDWAVKAKTPAQYQQAVLSFFAAFRDGHFTVILELDDMKPDYHWAGIVAADYGGAYYVGGAAEDQKDLLGAELASCDGLEPSEIFTLRVAPFYPGSIQGARIRNPSSRLVTHHSGAFHEPLSQCEFIKGGAAVIRTLQWRKAGDTYQDISRKVVYGVRETPGVKEYRPGRWWITASDFYVQSDEELVEIEAMIRAAEENAKSIRNAEAIVIDIRGNQGGNSNFGRRLADAIWGEGYRKSREPVSATYVDWRASDGNISHIEGLVEILKKQNAPQEDIDWITNIHAGMVESARRGEIFYREESDNNARSPAVDEINPVKGETFFLTNINCGSACLDFADILLSLENVTQIGDDTASDTQYMEVRLQDAPSGFAKFVIPVKVYRDRVRAPNEYYEPKIRYEGHDWSDDAIVPWVDSVIDTQLRAEP